MPRTRWSPPPMCGEDARRSDGSVGARRQLSIAAAPARALGAAVASIDARAEEMLSARAAEAAEAVHTHGGASRAVATAGARMKKREQPRTWSTGTLKPMTDERTRCVARPNYPGRRNVDTAGHGCPEPFALPTRRARQPRDGVRGTRRAIPQSLRSRAGRVLRAARRTTSRDHARPSGRDASAGCRRPAACGDGCRRRPRDTPSRRA